MILLADSGSTKTAWCVADKGTPMLRCSTAGINPFFQNSEEISREIKNTLLPLIDAYAIDRICFYGAGCASSEHNEVVANAICSVIPSQIEVHSDLLGAARALCATDPGIVCIIGTGSNSGLYDGKEITQQIPPLGFILGDEGSGAVLGKLLVGDCLKKQLPTDLIDKFMTQFGLTPAMILDRVYKQPFPNRFLASLSPFLKENIAEPSIYNIVYAGFSRFFTRNIMQYDDHDKLPIHFIGSVAFHYQEVLKEVAAALQLQTGIISQTPMEGLIAFHA